LLILAGSEMAETVFTPSLEGMKHVKAENGVILTKPFLEVCKQILPVLGNSLSWCLPLIHFSWLLHCLAAGGFEISLCCFKSVIWYHV
jgi:hypothetical protein